MINEELYERKKKHYLVQEKLSDLIISFFNDYITKLVQKKFKLIKY